MLAAAPAYSVRQVLTETARITGLPVPHTVGPRRPGDSPCLVGNIEKSRREFGWLPTRDLDIQIEDTLRWRRKMPR
jgi:UDP-glucose 4-epimerase